MHGKGCFKTTQKTYLKRHSSSQMSNVLNARFRSSSFSVHERRIFIIVCIRICVCTCAYENQQLILYTAKLVSKKYAKYLKQTKCCYSYDECAQLIFPGREVTRLIFTTRCFIFESHLSGKRTYFFNVNVIRFERDVTFHKYKENLNMDSSIIG